MKHNRQKIQRISMTQFLQIFLLCIFICFYLDSPKKAEPNASSLFVTDPLETVFASIVKNQGIVKSFFANSFENFSVQLQEVFCYQ